MELLAFSHTLERQIDRYGSIGASIYPIIRQADGLSVVSIWIEPHGVLGLHPAAADQLLLVTAGEAFVSTPDNDEQPVKSSMAVLWRKGEVHQTRAGSSGLMAIVIEAEGLAGWIHMLPPASEPKI